MPTSHACMHSFWWTKRGSIGETLKKSWTGIAPKPAASCTTDIASNVVLVKEADRLRSGGSFLARGNLCHLSPELSLRSLQCFENRIEGLARHLWCTQKGSWAGITPLPAGASVDRSQQVEDTFWKDNDICLPLEWPTKCTIPILLTDLSRLPRASKFRVGALDEIVASFWWICVKLEETLQEAKKTPTVGAQGGQSPQGVQSPEMFRTDGAPGSDAAGKAVMPTERVADLERQKAIAQELATNVLMEFWFVGDADAFEAKSISLREEPKVLDEYCTLTGWERIAIIGQKRDVLRQKKMPDGPGDVKDALSVIKWGPNRAVTTNIASRCIGIWDKLRDNAEIMLLLRESKKFYGPNGPFEDWSFLNILCSKFSNLDALQWVMATMLYERRHRRRSSNLTCDDLKAARANSRLALGVHHASHENCCHSDQ